MGCVDSAQRFLICVSDPLCTSTIKHKFEVLSVRLRLNDVCTKQFFLNRPIAFICN